MIPPDPVSSAADSPHVPGSGLVERFCADMAALWPAFIATGEGRLGLAVSGGPDSLAMLLLAAAAFPGRVEAATVDHGLRPESAAEAAGVAAACAALGVCHAVLAVTVEAGNVQSAARKARYGALAAWLEHRGLQALLTAHHGDDQAETLLMRLNRASGVAGLAGARARGTVPGTQLPLLRPLLGWRRSDLAGVVQRAGMVAAQDPGNSDDRFDRARLRKRIADSDWLDIGAIAESASHLADADAAIDWAAGREWQEAVSRDGFGFAYRPQAPRAIAIRVIRRIVVELDGVEPRGGAVARIFESLLCGKAASIGEVVARPLPGRWSFTRAPQRRVVKK